MARTDFYILAGNTTPARFSCSAAGKAYAQGNKVYIMAPDQAEAMNLDDLLWTYHDISFLPHARVGDAAASDAPIAIGWPGAAVPDADVLINLTGSVPDCVASFARIVEIVADEPLQKQLGRERYRQYRERGFELHTHDIQMDQANG
jgi:DNA polymerase-3 subunit chi